MDIDLPLLTQDFGKPVVVAGVTTTGLRDVMPTRVDAEQANLAVDEISLLCPTDELPALAEGMAITWDGIAYVVQFWEADASNRDGRWTRIFVEVA